MEKRRHRRIKLNLNAKIISQGHAYAGLTENVSEGGLEYLITSSFEVTENFALKKNIDLLLQIPSGETLTLSCEVRWFLRPSVLNTTLTLGLKILNPPPPYKEFIHSLNTDGAVRTTD
jgi:hypothetical protein